MPDREFSSNNDRPDGVTAIPSVTNIVQAREELEKSEVRFRAAARATVDLIAEGNVLADSVAWHGDVDSALGYEPGEFPRTVSGWLEAIHPDDIGNVNEAFEGLMEGSYFDTEYRIRCRDGTYRHWVGRGEATSWSDGKATTIVGSITDITERVLAQQELETALAEANEHSDRSQAILSSVDSHIALLDAQGNIIEVNDAWVHFGLETGASWPPKAGIQANYLDACRDAADDIPDAQRALSGILSVLNGTRTIFTMAYGCHIESEERWFVMTVTPVKACNGGAVITHRDITERMIARRELESTLKEVSRLKDQIQSEQQYLREEIKSDHDFDDIIGGSEGIRAALDAVGHVAGTDATVLLLGETGTGKELFARAIHANSKRSDRALIKVDCATLPEGLVESELFGHLKGAYTGADSSRAGRFELAHRGTIFLDEIGELSTTLQAKLLRFLQEGEIQRLGAEKVQNVDVRVIAATNRNLRREVEEGRFRSDLFYRLNVFPIEIPPLRHRADDIPLLTAFFISKCSFHFGRQIEKVPFDAQRMLAAYDWPGNVRELQNVIERSVILSRGNTLELAGIPREVSLHSQSGSISLKQDLKEIERLNILKTLDDCHWKIKGEGNAASQLGLKPSTLRSRMKTLGISRPAP